MYERPEATADDITFDRAFAGAPGELVRLSPLVRRMAAGNPGPMTFTGTCTYVVGAGKVAIIDPGPDRKEHIDALLQSLRGETIAAILVTHTHKDHSPGARALKAATGARIIGCAPHAPEHAKTASLRPDGPHDGAYAPDSILREGDAFETQDFALVCVETPGHTANHLAFFLPQEQALFSGDHVMAWSTSLVTPPDGSMRDYVASLEKRHGLVDLARHAAGRLDARLRGLARKAAPARRSRLLAGTRRPRSGAAALCARARQSPPSARTRHSIAPCSGRRDDRDDRRPCL